MNTVTLKNKFKVWAGIIVLFSCISFVSFADTSKINAGLLSDIWFSSLNLEYKQDVIIYTSFQNTFEKEITIEAEFFINEESLGKTSIVVPSDSVKKISHPWNVKAGKFDIMVRITQISIDSVQYSPGQLIKSETSAKIKVNRQIDIEYVTEIGTQVFNSVVTTVNTLTDTANQKLESLKSPTSNNSNNSNSSGDLVTGDVAGYEYEREDSLINNEGTVAGIEYEREDDGPQGQIAGGEGYEGEDKGITGSSFSFKNTAISILQFMLSFWYIIFPFLVILIIWWMLRKRD